MVRRTFKMKDLKIKNVSLAMAFAMTLSMTTAGCSSESENIVDNIEQPGQPTANGVRITVSAGISDNEATRSEVDYNTTTKKRTLKFTSGDRLYVYGKIADDKFVAGYLVINETSLNEGDGKRADFSGQVNAYDAEGTAINYVLSSDPLAECTTATATLVHEGINTDAISITPGKDVEFYPDYMIAANVNALMTSCLKVQGEYDSENKKFALTNSQAIFNCILSGLTASTSYKVGLYYETSSVICEALIADFTTDANGVGSFAIASSNKGNYPWTIKITQSDNLNEIGTIDLGTREITAKVYNVTRQFVNLANVSGPTTLQDGDIAIGTLANNVKISIAAGATVSLSGVNINDQTAWVSGDNAGITCLGNATIILADGTTNTVKGFDGTTNDYPGILAAHNGSGDEYTLTIKGTGTLNATGGGHAAGIGGGYYVPCGNITIENGTVNATAGGNAAGIGSGENSSCGTITISGGDVTATAGLNDGGGVAIGIGYNETTGTNGSCTKIQINNTMNSVTMIKSNVSQNPFAGEFLNATDVYAGSHNLKDINAVIYGVQVQHVNGLDQRVSTLASAIDSQFDGFGSSYDSNGWKIWKKSE